MISTDLQSRPTNHHANLILALESFLTATSPPQLTNLSIVSKRRHPLFFAASLIAPLTVRPLSFSFRQEERDLRTSFNVKKYLLSSSVSLDLTSVSRVDGRTCGTGPSTICCTMHSKILSLLM